MRWLRAESARDCRSSGHGMKTGRLRRRGASGRRMRRRSWPSRRGPHSGRRKFTSLSRRWVVNYCAVFFRMFGKTLTPKSPLFASLEKLERCSPEFVPEFESYGENWLSLRGGKSDGVPSRALPGEQPCGQWQTRKSRRRALPGEDRRYGDRGRRYGES